MTFASKTRTTLVMRPTFISACFFVFVLSARAASAAACPAVGLDTDCGTIITITNTGITITATGQGPYDGIEDTLVGVVNNSSVPIRALGLRSALCIFCFDGDGIVTYGVPGNASDSSGYGGPNSYFTNINASRTSGIVNFVAPLAANGGTTYFSLEEALGSISCQQVVNNSIQSAVLSGGTLLSGFPSIEGRFVPQVAGLNIVEAAQACGFADFDWVQTITSLPDPSPFKARNLQVSPTTGLVGGRSIPIHLGGAFNPATAGTEVHLTSGSVRFNDPPQGGGYSYQGSPDYSYPFYCDPTGDVACPRTATTLSFHDTVNDYCLSGPLGIPSLAYLFGTSTQTAAQVQTECGNTTSAAGSFIAFTTNLAGVNLDGTPTDLGVGYSWRSNYNGTFGGIATTKNSGGTDANSGTGGVTVTGMTETTTYQYQGVTVTTVNGGPPTGPTISALSATPNVLWPPDHKMVQISITANASDGTATAPVCAVTSVSSNEGAVTPGEPDWVITGELGLSVRADRSGGGIGRLYTITVTCTNGSPFQAIETVIVKVPHDQGR